MQDLQFARTFESKSKKLRGLIRGWLFPIAAPLKQITIQEEKWANQLSANKSREFKHSRGYVRLALSQIFGVNPLEIPLLAPPGKAPTLKAGWGYISLSHCKNALLVGWAPYDIGVDIEPANRSFNTQSLIKRVCTVEETKKLYKLNIKEIKELALTKWVSKEAAIKWQRGKLFQDIGQWESLADSNIYTHRTLGKQVFIYLINLKSWKIAIAANQIHRNSKPIICCQ